MSQKRHLGLLGWREWVELSDLGIPKIKAKVDSGARSSSLHAEHVQVATSMGRRVVSFVVYPFQRNKRSPVHCKARLLEYRSVRSSSGVQEKRPVIKTSIKILNKTWPIELTLTDRDAMGFRMLIGREAIRNRFLVHPGTSFLTRPQPNKKERGLR